MKHIFKSIVVFFLLNLLLTFFAQSAKANNVEINKIKQDVLIIKSQQELEKKQFDYLTQDTKDFKEFIQRERKEHQEFLENLYQKTCWAGGLLISLFIGLASFFGWKSLKNIEQQVESEIKNKAKQVIDEANSEIEKHLSILNGKVESELSYKKANIFVLSATEGNDLNRVINTLKSKGINHIKLTSNLDELDEKFCLIICNLNGNDNRNELAQKTMQYMSANSIDIPIIFYTTGRIDQEILSDYPFYFIPANNPTTLIMHCFTLLKMFC